jgi:hypothetical protein
MMSSAYFTIEDCADLGAGVANTAGIYDKFLELHKALHRRLRDQSWDLHPHWDRTQMISNYSTANSGAIAGMALRYTRSREQALLVERLMGREDVALALGVDSHRHPVIEVRLTPNHVAVELVVSAASWLDQQNLIGKLGVPRHRQALKSIIQRLPTDTCIGFWSGVDKDDMHLTAAQLSRGLVLDEWISTFQDGHDFLRVGMWYEPQAEPLQAGSIVSELTRRIGALYNVYSFLLWSSNNDFRTFYQKRVAYGSNRDIRL